MDIRERQRLYKEKVEADASITGRTRMADAFGVSNSTKIIKKGLFAFNANFNTMARDVDQVVVNCLLRFPPEDEIYFSLFMKGELRTFLARLEEMRAAGSSHPRRRAGAEDEDKEDSKEGEGEDAAVQAASPDRLDYTNNNKNVKGYIALNGQLYLRNKSYWDSMPDDLATISKPVALDRVLFSIYPPAVSARRSLLAQQFLGYLGNLIGREKVHELQVWPDASAVHADMRRMPATIPLADIKAAVVGLGGFYLGGEVRRFHAGLNFLDHKHFVILSGLSGTGKTQLALKYARAVHGLTDMAAPDPFLSVCPVRPEWTDPTGLTGYYDVLSNRYIVPPFLEAVMLATAHRESPVFVLLDEMNLARIEYYFSDVLSCIETGEVLQLHSNSVPLEGSTGTSIPAEMPLPPNLHVVGTINIDETTNPVSDKVLDRAIVIDMSAVQLREFLAGLVDREATLADARAACEDRLAEVHGLMAEHRLGFGYRVVEEVIRYHAFAREKLGAGPNETTDDLMVQKVLVKLRGAEKQRTLLTGLLRILDGLPHATGFLQKLVNDLDEYGSFQASR